MGLWWISIVLPAVLYAAHAIADAAYPTKPIRLVVPFPPGASNDIMARAVGQRLNEALGQPVIIDNRGGAGTAIGTNIVAKSTADGYTIMLTSISFTTNAAIQPNLPFDSVSDVTGAAKIGNAPMILVVHPSVPAKSAKEFLAFVKARPGQLNYVSSGIGTIPHLVTEVLMRDAKGSRKNKFTDSEL